MRITIDNEDGLGAVDYTLAVTIEGPITIDRELNKPSRCAAEIVLGLHGLATPARRGRVVVTNDAAIVLFTGYLATEVVAVYSGAGTKGPVYRARLLAVSDEWLLDKQSSGAGTGSDGLALALNGTSLVNQMTQAAQGIVSTGITLATGGNPRAVGAFAVSPAASWSSNAGAAANATYASYKVLNGAVSVIPAGAVSHVFSDADGSLDLSALSLGHARELANDITISGEEEPAAYVQEIFSGDGTTTEFQLANAVFRGTGQQLLWDAFNEASFDTSQWSLSDGGNHLTITSAGLTLNGGNGFDGQTTLTAVNALEMSGFLLIELGSVIFSASSAGMLAGCYQGSSNLADCFAGFRVRQSTSTTGGSTIIVPVVNGVENGTAYTPLAGHRYTLRLRLYCSEMIRVAQRYYCMADGVVQQYGSVGGVSAPMQLCFELVDEGVSSNTPATVLYDTAKAGMPIAVTPATCSFLAVNSENLYGSVGTISLRRPGSLWVSSTLPNGAQMTRLVGPAGQGLDCEASYGSMAGTAGKVTFFAGRVPVAGERVTVSYRTSRRAVARVSDQKSVTAETAAGAGVAIPGVSRWLGKVMAPVARSSADCEAAAEALLAVSTARSAALAGTYTTLNPSADMWPGDVFQLISAEGATALLIRSVTAISAHAIPEIVTYKLKFANDWATEWADGLGMKLGDTIASDVTLPVTAASGAAGVMANLQEVTVVSLTGSALQVDAGMDPPAGGGFEVRRRDWAFGLGVDTADLVLRSPVRSFSIPRSAQKENFYVRLYDGESTPRYSRYSSAVLVNWPLG